MKAILTLTAAALALVLTSCGGLEFSDFSVSGKVNVVPAEIVPEK